MNAGAILENRSSQLARALDPASVKVDGRDNRDRLAFVAAFSQLILYYDQNNQLAGNWQAFFMKDSSILLAAISKTDYCLYYSEFMVLDRSKLKSISADVDYVNRLVPLLQNLFATINQWFYLMELNQGANNLYFFLKKMIEENLAGQLSLMVALQQRMCNATKGIVVAPDTAFYSRFEPVWFSGQNRQRGLLLTDDMGSGTIGLQANAWGDIFHRVFDVFVQVIEHAKQAFYQQETQETPYPDTALLMAFSRLMETQQNEINQLGAEHLDFYYDRILQQNLQPAQADQVFVCLKLVDKAQSIVLPAGTLFKAGTYPDQSDILFGSDADIEINQAAISSVSTLYYDQTDLQPWGLYLNTITTPTQVVRNPLDEIVTWDGFGNNNSLAIQQGFAFSSPMLFLQGGLRIITITLVFTCESSSSPPVALTDYINAFSSNQFYLSTEKSWFSVSQESISINAASSSVDIIITLPTDAPGIVPFKINPDGFSSAWPILKIILGSSVDLSAPPILAKVNIQVDVEQFSHFSLANDISPLPNTGPQSIFGPVPQIGNCFYLGSNELFAKPVSSLMLNMNWDKLPLDFSDYYAQYNQYLCAQSTAFMALVNAAVTAATTAASDATTAATAATNTTAEAAAKVAEQAAQAALAAVKAVDVAATAAATSAAIAAAAAAAIAALTAAAAAAAIKTDETDVAIEAAMTATETAAVAAIATAALAFNNTAFMGRWSLLAAKYWQGLNVGITPSTFQPVIPATAVTIFKQILQWSVQSVLHLPTIVPTKLRQILTLILPSKKPTVVPSSVAALPPAEVSTPAAVPHLQSLPVPVPVSVPASVADPVQTAVILDAVPLFQQSSEPNRPNLPASAFTFAFDSTYTPVAELTLAPLPAVNAATNGYIRFELQTPNFAFGTSLYAQVISYISFENAQMLIQQAKSPTKPPPTPEPLPNPPYSPKLSTVQGSYTACAATEILANFSADPGAYPLELYHYGSFKPYLAYDATGGEQGYGFCNLTPQDRGNDSSMALPLFAGVGPGCLYVSLSGVVAPCTLTLFAQISADENQAAPDEGSIGYYYWTNTGWQPIKVLRNDTNNLTCSGIIAFDIPSLTPAEYQLTPAQQHLTSSQQIKIQQAEIDLSYLPSPIMSNADFQLAIATKPNSKVKGKSVNLKLSYLDTQAVKLTRVSTAALPSSEIPQIDANIISATQNKVAQIANIVQPFPSFGGLPAENKNNYGGATSFYRRVSERLNNKDRSVASTDFVDMAHGACLNLFFAKTIIEKRGVVRIGLVNGYDNAQLPNAFRPVVDAVDQAAIVKHIAARTSAMTKLSVFNLYHHVVKISTTLIIASQANANAMEQSINQQLRVYLSPWIRSDLPQRNLNEGIDHSALINFLTAQAGVISVTTLSVMVCIEADNDDESVLVSHKQHAITLVAAAGGQR